MNEDVSILRFHPEIDGRSGVEEVEVGRNNAHPPRNPFEVKLPSRKIFRTKVLFEAGHETQYHALTDLSGMMKP